MNIFSHHRVAARQSAAAVVPSVEQAPSATARPKMHRLASMLLVLTFALVGALAPAGTANASQRLANGAYGSYGLDCSGYRSARLTVQGGANGIPVNGFKYWLYSVDSGRYLVSGAWESNGTGWNTKTVTLTQSPGRYQVYVEYWSYTGGRWYAAGEWAYATNLTQPTTSLTCTVR